jgi:hypothetical protein
MLVLVTVLKLIVAVLVVRWWDGGECIGTSMGGAVAFEEGSLVDCNIDCDIGITNVLVAVVVDDDDSGAVTVDGLDGTPAVVSYAADVDTASESADIANGAEVDNDACVIADCCVKHRCSVSRVADAADAGEFVSFSVLHSSVLAATVTSVLTATIASVVVPASLASVAVVPSMVLAATVASMALSVVVSPVTAHGPCGIHGAFGTNAAFD